MLANVFAAGVLLHGGGTTVGFDERLHAVPVSTLTDSQMQCVAPNAVSIAQAHFWDAAWFRAVCQGDKPIGFVMVDTLVTDVPEANQPAVMLWRFMIGKPWQPKGCGRRSTRWSRPSARAEPALSLHLLRDGAA